MNRLHLLWVCSREADVMLLSIPDAYHWLRPDPLTVDGAERRNCFH